MDEVRRRTQAGSLAQIPGTLTLNLSDADLAAWRVSAGQQMQVISPEGQEVMFVVPEGAAPGSTISIQYQRPTDFIMLRLDSSHSGGS